jgi:signal transduction histidine kinase
MASLGELTAGVAHEIQNPLNFVNNFSDLNKELIADLFKELDEAIPLQRQERLHRTLPIMKPGFDHGRRADNIVKGMLSIPEASRRQRID